MNEEISRAELARQVLDNPMLKEAFTAIRAEIIEDFRKSSFRQQKLRDELHREMKTVDRVEDYLSEAIATGELVRHGMATRLKNNLF